MKRVVWIFAWLTVASPAFGQEPPKRAPVLRGMYEDIEVMRAILSRRLTSNCTQCHQGPVGGGSMMGGTMGGMSSAGGGAGPGMGTMSVGSDSGFSFVDVDRDGNLDLFIANNAHAGIARPEGVYLKGQGVVFQATIPAVPNSDLVASGAGQPPKTLSDWEKTRLRIRGEKLASTAPARQATLADTLLKSLADNGKNFAHLADNESLTIIITFRGVHGMAKASEAGMAGSGMGMPGMSGGSGGPGMGPPGGMMGAGGGGSTGPMGGAGGPGGGPPPMGGAGNELAGGGPISPDRELELLGDLHQKRGNWNDAASAYDRAIKKAGTRARARELAKKLAEVYLKTGELEKARQALDLGAAEQTDVRGRIKLTEPTAKPAIKLPTRLIVSASKKLLDQVGDGKISMAEFQKQATLEVLKFDETPKK